MTDTHNVQNALAALGGAKPAKPAKRGTGPVEARVVTSGEAIEDLGALVEANEGVTQELLALACQAALAADESREAGAKAKALKAELEEAMKAAEVTEVAMTDRDPIAFTTKPTKAKTLKALKQKMVEAATKALGESADDAATNKATAKAQAAAKTAWGEFWGRFPILPTTSLDIPKRRVVEPEPEA